MRAIQLSPVRLPAFALAEIAFLVSLTSEDSTVSSLAGKGLRLLVMAERQPDAPFNPNVNDEDRSKRNPVYEQLGDPNIVFVGEYIRSINPPNASSHKKQVVLGTRSESGSSYA